MTGNHQLAHNRRRERRIQHREEHQDEESLAFEDSIAYDRRGNRLLVATGLRFQTDRRTVEGRFRAELDQRWQGQYTFLWPPHRPGYGVHTHRGHVFLRFEDRRDVPRAVEVLNDARITFGQGAAARRITVRKAHRQAYTSQSSGRSYRPRHDPLAAQAQTAQGPDQSADATARTVQDPVSYVVNTPVATGARDQVAMNTVATHDTPTEASSSEASHPTTSIPARAAAETVSRIPEPYNDYLEAHHGTDSEADDFNDDDESDKE
ncbi:hypothetical protein CONLIGDRAFT_719336 [Coniochaeta ligniaria NRRL 30616]|uniref:RRM domain-containing protein n=1 Tax=Coniochaeta ligniaria NRRL 30616 TaxID=1408157 RepID=A0A1J7J228_9PEZI|nr:hypothetical protein CONLIGDRAFT_719336 [Coniochaeta ligniaria NRRL 30616]